MLKKYLLRFITLLVCLCLILSGCGSESNQTNDASQEESKTVETQTDDSEDAEEESLPNAEPDLLAKTISLAAAKKLLEENRSGFDFNRIFECGFADMNLDGKLEFILTTRGGTNKCVYPDTHHLIESTYVSGSAFDCNYFDSLKLYYDPATKTHSFICAYETYGSASSWLDCVDEIIFDADGTEVTSLFVFSYDYSKFIEDDVAENKIAALEEQGAEHQKKVDDFYDSMEEVEFKTYFMPLYADFSDSELARELEISYDSFYSPASPFVSPLSTMPTSDYVFPDSNHRYLTQEDIEGLTTQEIRIAKNEIYARRGRRFDSTDLQVYFNSKDWYRGTVDPKDFSDDFFNDYEKKNATFLDAIEKNIAG